jgi:hypothetical protein
MLRFLLRSVPAAAMAGVSAGGALGPGRSKRPGRPRTPGIAAAVEGLTIERVPRRSRRRLRLAADTTELITD